MLALQLCSTGTCSVSLDSSEAILKLATNGILVRGNRNFPIPVESPTLQLHIHDTPVWVADSAITISTSSRSVTLRVFGFSTGIFFPQIYL